MFTKKKIEKKIENLIEEGVLEYLKDHKIALAQKAAGLGALGVGAYGLSEWDNADDSSDTMVKEIDKLKEISSQANTEAQNAQDTYDLKNTPGYKNAVRSLNLTKQLDDSLKHFNATGDVIRMKSIEFDDMQDKINNNVNHIEALKKDGITPSEQVKINAMLNRNTELKDSIDHGVAKLTHYNTPEGHHELRSKLIEINKDELPQSQERFDNQEKERLQKLAERAHNRIPEDRAIYNIKNTGEEINEKLAAQQLQIDNAKSFAARHLNNAKMAGSAAVGLGATSLIPSLIKKAKNKKT